MSNEKSATTLHQLPSLIIPAAGPRADGSFVIPARRLSLEFTKAFESRVLDTRTVNPSTYNDLEYTLSLAYQELKGHFAEITYSLAKAEKMVDDVRAEVLLDRYPEFIKDKPRSMDTPDTRKSFVQKDEGYSKALEYRDMLKAYEMLIEGRIKAVEKISAYMKKQMDLLIRSGSMPKLGGR
jgi:hypothetical protein